MRSLASDVTVLSGPVGKDCGALSKKHDAKINISVEYTDLHYHEHNDAREVSIYKQKAVAADTLALVPPALTRQSCTQ
jgi:hypothetical protein